MRKTIITLIFILLFSTNGMAENGGTTLSEFFLNMPDSMMPYLPMSQRKELVDIKNMEPDSIATVSTALGEVRMTRLTDNVLTLQLSENSRIEIGRMDGSRFLCINTYGAPLQESKCRIYGSDWKELETVDFSATDLPKPTDKEEADQQEELLSNAEFTLVSVTMTDTPRELNVKYDIPLTYKDDNNDTTEQYLQRNIKWKGGSFN